MNWIEFYSSLSSITIAILVGYSLGSVPLAAKISRRLGVDIFSVGNGLPGASNVFHNVGAVPALFVLLGDMGKGAITVVVGKALGVDGVLVMLPVTATIIGHWKPMFTRFRGGDGIATLGGGTLALFPLVGLISAAVAILVTLGAQRLPYNSLLGTAIGYTTLIILTTTYNGDSIGALANMGVAGLVLAHAAIGQVRRRKIGWDITDNIQGSSGRDFSG